MGGFYLVSKAAADSERIRAIRAFDASFARQGLAPAHRLETRGHLLQTFRKRGQPTGGEVWMQDDPDRFVAACGTLSIAGKSGRAALEHLSMHPHFDFTDSATLGNFCIIESDAGGLKLRCDPLGLMQIFRNSAGTLWSSSFLALLAATEERRFNSQAVYEYVFTEMPLGRETLATHIQLHDCRMVAQWQPKLTLSRSVEAMPNASTHSGDLVARCASTLQSVFASLASSYPDRIDSGLSGGYDSRLILAALLSVGAKPHLHVYGNADSIDVRIAKRVASAAGLELHHIDKAKGDYPSPAEYRDKALEWLHAFDGFAADGIMGNGQDIATRQKRVSEGRAALNGGGGEIFRNFFYLPDRTYSRRQLLWTFFSQFDAAVTNARFSIENYYQALEAKLADCVGHDRTRLSRREIEWIYTAFRCRFWMGRNNCVNSRLGAYFTPLMTWSLARLGLDIPMHRKNHGRFESQLIAALAPDLARIETAYGHDLSGPIPMRRIVSDTLTLMRPPFARRWSFTLKSRFRPPPLPAWHKHAAAAIDPKLPRMREYFDVEKVRDSGQLNRLFTLELLGEFSGLS